MKSFKALSLNLWGFHNTDLKPNKHSTIINHINSIKPNLLLLQDTHTNTLNETDIYYELPHFSIYFNHATSKYNGSLIAIDKSFIHDLSVKHTLLCPGYTHQLCLLENNTPVLIIINVYLPPDQNQNNTQLLNQIHQQLTTIKKHHKCSIIIGGDFNFIMDADDHSAGILKTNHNTLRNTWSSIQADLFLQEPPNRAHTHYSSSHRSTTRIDRFYFNMKGQFYFPQCWSCTSSNNISDHNTLILNFSTPTPVKSSFPNLPKWVCTHPYFLQKMQYIINKHIMNEMDPFIALFKIKKSAINSVKSIIRRKPLTDPTSVEFLHILQKSKSFLHTSSPMFANAFKVLQEFDLITGSKILTVDNTSSLKNIDAEIDRIQKEHPYPKRMAKPTKHITIPNKRNYLLAIMDPTTNAPTDDQNRMAEITIDFWQEYFKEPPPFQIPPDYQPISTNTPWPDYTIDDIIDSINSSNSSSAPGPDGIPFTLYKSFPNEFGFLFFKIMKQMEQTQLSIPLDFNFAKSFLIPKKNDSILIEDTRLISVSNTDNRIIARTIANLIQTIIHNFIHPHQNGFIKGRDIRNNFNLINNAYYNALTKKQTAFILFIDFAKAYDNVHREYITLCLKQNNCPPPIVNLIHNLHQNTINIPAFKSTNQNHFVTYRGVKQGCPLSPLLFNITLDYLLLTLQPVIEKQKPGIISAFADDIAICFSDPTCLPQVINKLQTYQIISNASLNIKKCSIIGTDDEALSQLHNPLGIPITSSYKYLGLPIGRRTNIYNILEEARKKLHNVASHIKKLHLPLADRFIAINTYLIPIFSYIMRYYLLPLDIIKEIIVTSKKLIDTMNSFGQTLVLRNKREGGFSRCIRDPKSMNLALLLSKQNRPLDLSETFNELDTRYHYKIAMNLLIKHNIPKFSARQLYSTFRSLLLPDFDTFSVIKRKWQHHVHPHANYLFFPSTKLPNKFFDTALLFMVKGLPLFNKLSKITKGSAKCPTCENDEETNLHFIIECPFSAAARTFANIWSKGKVAFDEIPILPINGKSQIETDLSILTIYSLWLLRTKHRSMDSEWKLRKFIDIYTHFNYWSTIKPKHQIIKPNNPIINPGQTNQTTLNQQQTTALIINQPQNNQTATAQQQTKSRKRTINHPPSQPTKKQKTNPSQRQKRPCNPDDSSTSPPNKFQKLT